MNLSGIARGLSTGVKNIFSTETGEGITTSYGPDVLKAIIPWYLYRPPFGRPRNIDATEIRNLAECPYIESIIDTITTECTSMNWEIVENNGMKASESDIDDATFFFKNPNDKKEDIKKLISLSLRDIMIHDAGVFNKVFDLASYDEVRNISNLYGGCSSVPHFNAGILKPLGERNMSQLYVYDGITFTKDPDLHGRIPEHNGYWQYYFSTAAYPIAFNRDEIMWIEQRPRTYSVYGLSPIELLKDILYALIFGVKGYSDFYMNNTMPPAILSLVNANDAEIKSLKERFKKRMMVKDPKFNVMRRKFSDLQITNAEAKLTPFIIPPRELEYLGQQQWFIKLVWMVFGVTPSEMGITDSSNRATELSQNRVFKRKAVKPRLDLLSYHFTNEILPEFGFQYKTINHRKIAVPTMKFIFTGFDVDEELEKQKLNESKLKMGQITVNEWRKEEKNLKPVEWGDKPYKGAGGGFGQFNSEFEKFQPNNMAQQQTTPPKPNTNLTPPKEIKPIPAQKPQQAKALETTAGGRNETGRTVLIPEAINKIRTLKQAEDQFEIILTDFLKQKQFELSRELNELQDSDILSHIKGTKAVGLLNFVEGIKGRLLSLMDPKALTATTSILISKAFNLGLKKAEKDLKLSFTPNQPAVNYIKSYTFQNIKGMTDDTVNKLRQEFERGIMQGEGPAEISKRVEDVFAVSKARANAIARTELNRAFNEANLEGYKQSGIEGEKEWDAILDSKTSDICKTLNDRRVPLDEKFRYKGQEYTSPPAHVNCRSTMNFIPMPKSNVTETEKKNIAEWKEKGVSVCEMSRLLGRPKKTIYKYLPKE